MLHMENKGTICSQRLFAMAFAAPNPLADKDAKPILGKVENKLVLHIWVFYLACQIALNATQKPLFPMILGLQESVKDTVLVKPASLEHIGIVGPVGHLNPGKNRDKVGSTWRTKYPIRTNHPVETNFLWLARSHSVQPLAKWQQKNRRLHG